MLANYAGTEYAKSIYCMVMSAATSISASAVQIEDRIDRIFDHLYANAPVRTPKGIAFEVGKILHTAMYIESGKSDSPAFAFSRQEQRRLENGDPELVKFVAQECRKNFLSMNKAWRLYPAREQIVLSEFDLAYVCSALSYILVSDKKRDVFGDALEIFRYEWAKRNGGQFFTDQKVTHLAIRPNALTHGSNGDREVTLPIRQPPGTDDRVR